MHPMQHPRPMQHKEYVRWLRVNRPAASVMALLSLIGGTLLACAFSMMGTEDSAPVAGPGPCVPGTCPGAYPEPNNGPVTSRDNGVNIFVGGDYTVRQAAADAEGRIVVLGDFDVSKAAGVPPAYNVGVVGTGSRVPPENGSPFLRIGGDLKVAAGQRLVAEQGPVSGTVAYAGSVHTGTVSPKAVRDVGTVALYGPLREELTSASNCYAYERGVARRSTGTAVNQGAATVFTGDGRSRLQVFNAPFDLVAPGGGAQELLFRYVPDGATVLVNVTNPDGGTARAVSTSSGRLTGVRRERLLWNFPDAKEVRLTGGGQLDGTVLVGRRSSVTRVTLPGINGRFFTAGSLIHESGPGAGGQALHAYPFDGSLPDCGTTLPADPADSGEPLPLPVPSGPAAPAVGPAGLAGAPGASWAPVQDAPVAGDGHELARTGPPMGAYMAAGTALVAAGAGLALVVLFRTRMRVAE
ncbi:choice-of-anchor A family protein [Streptomyces sp. NPDC037389]|uniref:choice-of-anchor A family protein n=1 Tax=Streptomyces sp. NPDC037389 TaxID=3155369 RepID=UPI0033DCA8BD